MRYYDEDFYNEPSEFELQIQEFKDSLFGVVKKEFIEERKRLQQENDELREVKRNFEKIQQEYQEKHRQLEYERKDLERKVRKERLSTLMKDFQVTMYMAYSKRELPPKCNRCDENRKIAYKTPLGRDALENCECSIGHIVYYPEEYILTSFSVDHDKNKMNMWYKLKPADDDDYATLDNYSTFAKVVYNGDLVYEKIDQSHTFFKSEEECQRYCDYLNLQKK